jgi:hypothetical protein
MVNNHFPSWKKKIHGTFCVHQDFSQGAKNDAKWFVCVPRGDKQSQLKLPLVWNAPWPSTNRISVTSAPPPRTGPVSNIPISKWSFGFYCRHCHCRRQELSSSGGTKIWTTSKYLL